jgi:Tol biopolymer transport system component
MPRFLNQTPTLRRIRRVYWRILVLGLSGAIGGCQDAAEPFAPDPTDDPAPTGAVVTQDAVLPGPLGTLVSNRIVFSGYKSDGSADIFTMDAQGGTVAHLTNFASMEWAPMWSYDHKRIAFGRARNGYSDVYVMNADGTNKHWARSATYSGNIDEFSWSPDGTNLLVKVAIQGRGYLARIDLASGNMALIAPMGYSAVEGRFPIYDPTGKSIFYLDNTGQNIKRFTPGGAVTTVLISGMYLGRPAISPDGTRLVFPASVPPNNPEIYVFNFATQITKRLTANSATDYYPTWSPDGTKIAFSSDRSGKLQIWTMNSSTGGSLTRITSRTYGAHVPSWAH